MSKLMNNRWIRPVSIAAALLVPAVVLAQSVSFAPGDVLDAGRLNLLARRTLDKRNIYVVQTDGALLDPSGIERVTAACNRGAEDVMLHCGCGSASAGSNAIAVRFVRMTVSGPGTNAAAQACVCAGQNVAANNTNQVAATAVCIDIPE